MIKLCNQLKMKTGESWIELDILRNQFLTRAVGVDARLTQAAGKHCPGNVLTVAGTGLGAFKWVSQSRRGGQKFTSAATDPVVMRSFNVSIRHNALMHVDSICRTAMYVTRTHGGVGGWGCEASSYPD